MTRLNEDDLIRAMSTATKSAAPGVEVGTPLHTYRQMIAIRLFEERANDLYTRALMPGAGFVLGGRAWWKAGRFLGPNIEAFHRRWPMDRLFEAWREAGMVDVEDEVMSLGGGLVMWGQKQHA